MNTQPHNPKAGGSNPPPATNPPSLLMFCPFHRPPLPRLTPNGRLSPRGYLTRAFFESVPYRATGRHSIHLGDGLYEPVSGLSGVDGGADRVGRILLARMR